MSQKQTDKKSQVPLKTSSRDTREYITPADLTSEEVEALEKTRYSADQENLDHLFD